MDVDHCASDLLARRKMGRLQLLSAKDRLAKQDQRTKRVDDLCRGVLGERGAVAALAGDQNRNGQQDTLTASPVYSGRRAEAGGQDLALLVHAIGSWGVDATLIS